MLTLVNPSTDPRFNLAAEEYLLHHVDGEIVMLWRNEPSVILGRNQNAFSEINADFVRREGIHVVRRITGGGAVFHDLGNVNFTFLPPSGSGGALDFARFTAPVCEALRALGIEAGLSGRNDLMAGGKKISGNAQCVRTMDNGKKRVLHHGTLLYSTDLDRLENALTVDIEKIRAKGVKSIRARVGNIADLLPNAPDVTVFMQKLQEAFGGEQRGFSAEEREAITRLASKYASWEYTYGVSRQYDRVCRKRFPFGTVEIQCSAEHGVLTAVHICGDYFGVRETRELERRLEGTRLERKALEAALAHIGDYIAGATIDDILGML